MSVVSVGDIVAPGFEKIVGLASARRHGDLIKKSKELVAAIEKGDFALPPSTTGGGRGKSGEYVHSLRVEKTACNPRNNASEPQFG